MTSNLLHANSRILILSPHPDDEIIGCGALISKSRLIGASIHVAYITTGSTRQLMTGQTDALTREREIEDVSAEAGFSYEIFFRDDHFCKLDTIPQKDLIDMIENAIDHYKPTIICIPFGGSYNQDHRAVYAAAITALRPVPQQLRYMPPIVLEYEEPYAWSVSEPFTPNFYLDATDVYKTKSTLMKLHASQDRDPPFPRSTSLLEARLRLRGSEVGLDAAEAFRLLRLVVS